jgi:hypothetical protein
VPGAASDKLEELQSAFVANAKPGHAEDIQRNYDVQFWKFSHNAVPSLGYLSAVWLQA